MHGSVDEWRQEGRLCVWRYAKPSRTWDGWHLAADPIGCRSVEDLLHRLQGGGARHRTLRLEPITDAILRVPNYRGKAANPFAKLRIEFRPDDDQDFGLSADGDRLMMTVGNKGIGELAAAFAEVAEGGGDFGIAPSGGRNAERWMFWWMPDVNYRLEKRS